MLDFRMTTDDHAKDVYRDGKQIATILWHSSPRIVWFGSIDLTDAEETVAELKRLVAESKK